RIRNHSPKRHSFFRRISPINPRSWELASQPREECLPDPLPLMVRIHLQPVDPDVVPVLLESQRSEFRSVWSLRYNPVSLPHVLDRVRSRELRVLRVCKMREIGRASCRGIEYMG